MEIWDFTDTSLKPSLTIQATTPAKLTSMEFLPSANISGGSSNRQQLIACGDETGALHVLEVPHHLVRPLNQEKLTMETFLRKQAEVQQFHHF
jgi:hypothetical protein